MIPDKKMASAVGAKTARACDICVRKRARFYCGPDDAFLCQSCDESVHSANPLARRHERVRLKGASSSIKNGDFLPTWNCYPTKKPRTPRHRKKSNNHHLLVPELDTTTSMEDEEEQLLYRVPVYEYDQYNKNSGAGDLGSWISHGGFLPPSDFDMAEFAADVEALLGKGLDGENDCGIEELGLLISNPDERDDCSGIKVEKEEEEEVGEMEVLIREPFELSFDYDSPVDVKAVVETGIVEEKKEWKKMLLRLDYEAISSSWGNQGSPWMNGKRPEFNPDDDLLPLSTTGDCEAEVHVIGEVGIMMGGGQLGGRRDGGREARVSRYREKRRTRLFSKKIRYEVRKLNAEKRPRMKGRFVKRSSFPQLLAK